MRLVVIFVYKNSNSSYINIDITMRKFLITVNSQQFEVEVEEVKSANVAKAAPSKPLSVTPSQPVVSETNTTNGTHKITSPMPGNIFKVNVKPGDVVKKGQTLVVLEAMKMENEINAPADGKVVDVKVKVGQGVALGQILVELL
jgi:biotin carboxyl carrier protein